jgi:hypothetical protein
MSIAPSWETELAQFLTDLSAAQDELLTVLNRKLELLATADAKGLEELGVVELQLGERLQACYRRRCDMLERAGREGLPSDSLKSLTAVLPGDNRKQLQSQVAQAAGKSRLLQHQSLTNWVVTQRTLLHLSQLLEIIATGGRMRPTYGSEEVGSQGGLIDHAA